jgi:hypothetical protein
MTLLFRRFREEEHLTPIVQDQSGQHIDTPLFPPPTKITELKIYYREFRDHFSSLVESCNIHVI